MKILVTGASSGIGAAIYNHLKELGHEVLGVSRNGPDGRVNMRQLDDEGVQGIAKNGPFNVVILNHGIMSFQETEDEISIYRTNFKSYWQLLREGVGLVSPHGCFIMNSSVAGVIGDEEVPFYSALKAGIINLTKSYAKKLSPYGIRVNCFSPGFFDTNLVEGPAPQSMIDDIPFKREAAASEILPVVKMLIDSKYTTGQNIIIDGGLSL